MLLAVLLPCLGTCDSPSAHAASRAVQFTASEPVMLNPQDGPFSADKLIQVAYQYYSRVPLSPRYTKEERERYLTSPERLALIATHEEAMTNRSEWLALLKTVTEARPGYDIEDESCSYLLEPAYVAVVSGPERPGEPRRRMVAMVSVLAPLYVFYETSDDSSNPDGLPVARYDISAEFAPVVDIIEREIGQRFGYHRIDRDIAETPIPDIMTNGRWYGEVTLVDALFSDYRW